LAGQYPADAGIERDPHVIFVENFDEPSLNDMTRRWENVRNVENMSLSDDTPALRGRSLRMTHEGGKGSGGHLYRRLPPGYDRLHVRFYVKFDPQSAPVHQFFHVGGYNPSIPYPHGGAGERPRGDERFTTGVEPFRGRLDLGLLHLLDGHARQPAARATPGQQLHPRLHPESREVKVDLRRIDDETERCWRQ
jgi:hypothetical protein